MKREKAAAEAFEKVMTERNPKAPVPGQAVFDALAKTMDCTWQQNSVIVLEQVQVDPPYEAENCTSLDGNQPALDRIKRILSNVRRKWRRADLKAKAAADKQILQTKPETAKATQQQDV